MDKHRLAAVSRAPQKPPRTLRTAFPSCYALTAFDSVIKTTTDQKLLSETTPAWALEFERRDPDKVPYPATFLRKGQWAAPPPKREHKATGVSERVKRIAAMV